MLLFSEQACEGSVGIQQVRPSVACLQEVLNVLITVNQLASERIEYSLECMLVLEADKVDSIGEAAGAAAATAGEGFGAGHQQQPGN